MRRLEAPLLRVLVSTRDLLLTVPVVLLALPLWALPWPLAARLGRFYGRSAALGTELADGEERRIRSIVAALKMVLGSSDREAIQKWTQALNDATRHLAEVVMNRSVQAALSGRSVNDI